MIKKICRYGLIALIMASSQCSQPFSPSTQLGESLITDTDPSIVAQSSFETRCTLPVLQKGSFTFAAGNLSSTAGVNNSLFGFAFGNFDSTHAVPYFEFTKTIAAAFASVTNDSLRNLVTGVSLVLHADSLFALPPGVHTYYLAISKKKIHGRRFDAATMDTFPTLRYPFTMPQNDTIIIPLDKSFLDSMHLQFSKKDTTDSSTFNLYIDSDSPNAPLIRCNNAGPFLRISRPGTAVDSIYAKYRDYTATSPKSRDSLVQISSAARRTGYMTVGLSAIWDALRVDSGSILLGKTRIQTMLNIKAFDSLKTDRASSSIKATFGYALLSSPIADAADSILSANYGAIADSFSRIQSPDSTNVLSFQVASFLQKMITDHKQNGTPLPTTGYLYLALLNPDRWGTCTWDVLPALPGSLNLDIYAIRSK